MQIKNKLLILGGTHEAAIITRTLAEYHRDHLSLVTSWAGRTATIPNLPGEIRKGHFGGVDALTDYIKTKNIKLLIDATHPFAKQISSNARKACERVDIPRLQFNRPPWKRMRNDLWVEANSLGTAAHIVPKIGQRAFLTTGVRTLKSFSQTRSVHFVIRLLNKPCVPIPLLNYNLIVSTPPFLIEDEIKLIRQYNIQVLITKDSGGINTESKIIAARQTGIPVLYVRRPKLEPGEIANSIDQALLWVKKHISSAHYNLSK